jgi:hypothetical protein
VFNGNRVAMKELVLANARTDIRNDEDKTPGMPAPFESAWRLAGSVF